MSRSGWIECDDLDEDDQRRHNLFRANVRRSIKGKKGQAFFRELADALDAMPVKRLIRDELVAEDGDVCAIGAVCKSRGLDTKQIDYECPEQVAALVGIPEIIVSEIEWKNDEAYWSETPEQRWKRMREWVESHLLKSDQPQ